VIEVQHVRGGRKHGDATRYDVDGDGRVTLKDVLSLSRNFGRHCEHDHHEHHEEHDD